MLIIAAISRSVDEYNAQTHRLCFVPMFAVSLYAENWLVVLEVQNGNRQKKVSFGVATDATDDYDAECQLPYPLKG